MGRPDQVVADAPRGWPRSAQPARISGLDCVVERQLPVAVLRLCGRLDLSTVPKVRHALGECLAEQPAAIVVHLGEMTIGDEASLAVFGTFAQEAADWPGCPVALTEPTPAAADGLERLGASRHLSVYPDPALALAIAAQRPAQRRCSRVLDPIPLATRVARRLVTDACQEWDVGNLADVAEVIVTELVSNAVVHARTEMRVLVTLCEPVLHLSVRDRALRLPRRLNPDPETGEGGRGLILIEAMASAWGVTVTGDGKIVWATLRTRPGGHRGR